jgi:drug/metabolite transporter (DMT)-like permease
VSPVIVALVLGAALLNAAWNAMVKSVSDRLTALALVNLGAAALALPFALFLPAPAAESWPFIALSVVVNHCYFGALLLSFRYGDLSLVYPLGRGASPLIVAAAAWLVAGEALSGAAIAAVLLLSGSILSLALAGRGDGRAVFWALAAGLGIAGFTISDGLGARVSGSPLGYAAWMFVLNGPPLACFALVLRGRDFVAAARAVWRRSLLGSTFFVVNYAIVIWAMTEAPLALVSALREVSVLFAALIGARLLGEPFGGRRLLAAAGVCAGAALLQFARAYSI